MQFISLTNKDSLFLFVSDIFIDEDKLTLYKLTF